MAHSLFLSPAGREYGNVSPPMELREEDISPGKHIVILILYRIAATAGVLILAF